MWQIQDFIWFSRGERQSQEAQILPENYSEKSHNDMPPPCILVICTEQVTEEAIFNFVDCKIKFC